MSNVHAGAKGGNTIPMSQEEFNATYKRGGQPTTKVSSEGIQAIPGANGEARRVVLTLPYPPSVNHYWRQARGHFYISVEGKAYRDSVFSASRGVRSMFDARLAVVIYATMPDRRVRDLDNLNKCLLDSLAFAQVYRDDSQIDDLRIVRVGVEKPGRVVVEIREINSGHLEGGR